MATKTIAQLEAEIKDLSSRLYYCSNTGEGRKMRRWIESAIRAKEKQIDKIGKGSQLWTGDYEPDLA